MNDESKQPESAQPPAISTLSWLSGAWQLLRHNSGLWMFAGGIMLVAMIMALILSWLGQIALSLLTPVFIGGLLVGCANIDTGKPMKLAHFSIVFKDTGKLKKLMLLGVFLLLLYLALMAICLGLFMAMGGEPVIADLRLLLIEQLPESRAAELVQNLMPLVVLLIISLCLYFMASLFSIPHVTFRNADAFSAMLLSLYCSLRYFATVFGCGMAMFAISVIATIILRRWELSFAFLMIGIWPFAICLQYKAYIAVFGGPDSESDEQKKSDPDDGSLSA